MSSAPDLEGIPLCVDLDGTLIKTDSLWEGLVKLFYKNPLRLIASLCALTKSRAEFKLFIAADSKLHAQDLPLRSEVVDMAKRSTDQGDEVYLVTGAPERIANSVADTVGFFTGVYATNPTSGNLTSSRKAALLVREFGDKKFDYVGDSNKDVAVWQHAKTAYAVNISRSTRRKAEDAGIELVELKTPVIGWRPWAKLIRVHQAIKNLLIFLPLLLAHELQDIGAWADTVVAFLSFTLLSYGSYIWNDLHDLETDRAHPTKRFRPLASGAIQIPSALAVSFLLVFGGIALSATVNIGLTVTLLTYLIVTVSYSGFIKSIAVADVIVLAGLYTLRIIAGAAAISAPLSIWVMLTSIFMFFSLALMKRHSEFVKYESETLAGRGYRLSDRFAILSTGISSSLVAVLVVGLYIDSAAVSKLYTAPELLWAVLPLLLFWSTRLWFLTERGEMNDDPIAFTITDRVSQIVVLLLALIVVAASMVRL